MSMFLSEFIQALAFRSLESIILCFVQKKKLKLYAIYTENTVKLPSPDDDGGLALF